jgi:hypothetical protein
MNNDNGVTFLTDQAKSAYEVPTKSPEELAVEAWTAKQSPQARGEIQLFEATLELGQKVLRVAGSLSVALEGVLPAVNSGKAPLQTIFLYSSEGIQVPDTGKLQSLRERAQNLVDVLDALQKTVDATTEEMFKP